jgi:hypothetical protein
MIYGDFPSIPLILVITLHNRKTPFCVFWRFRNLPELKLTQDFLGINILSWEPCGAQEVNKGVHKAQTSTGGATTRPGRATLACLAVEAPMSSIFIPGSSAWPKNTYINTPLSVFERRRRRNMKHRNKGCSSEDWRGKHCRSRPGRFSNLSDITTIDTTMKRE